MPYRLMKIAGLITESFELFKQILITNTENYFNIEEFINNLLLDNKNKQNFKYIRTMQKRIPKILEYANSLIRDGRYNNYHDAISFTLFKENENSLFNLLRFVQIFLIK